MCLQPTRLTLARAMRTTTSVARRRIRARLFQSPCERSSTAQERRSPAADPGPPPRSAGAVLGRDAHVGVEAEPKSSPSHDLVSGRCRLAGREVERRQEALRARPAGAGDVVGGAVIGGGAHERQAERQVHAVVEVEQLERNQTLVVVERDDRVVSAARGLAKDGVGDQRARRRSRGGRQRRSARAPFRQPASPAEPLRRRTDPPRWRVG